jgi:glycosyltransferase involved in cell wall biosynthesis
MKVLYLLHRVPWPLKDGGTIAVYNMLHGLKQSGAELTILAMNTTKHYVNAETMDANLSYLGEWHTVEVDNRVKIAGAVIALLKNESYHVSRFLSTVFAKKLETLLQQKQFDVVAFESIFMSPYLELVKQNTNAHCALRQHNVEYKIWEQLAGSTSNFLKKTYLNILASQLKRFEKAQIQKFDSVVAISQADAAEFASWGNTMPIKVSPTGIIGLKSSQQQLNSQAVYHIGSMEWKPNLDAVEWFIEKVWPSVRQLHGDAMFYVAGRGMPDAMKRYEGNGVIIVGEVENVEEFIRDKSIMVVPLLSGSGIRIKILEAMAAGKAIVTTETGVSGISCESGKHLIVANEVTTFANVLCRLIEDRVYRNSIGAQASALATACYDNEKNVKDLMVFYKEQVNKN